jgi:acetylornithine deacetylase/succinyl-diaminopimelate desuccinylase-like protein
MPDPLIQLEQYVESARPRFELLLGQLVSIPTVSIDPSHTGDIETGAKAAMEILENLGYQTQLLRTSGNPIIFGELTQNPSYPTVLIYNHLDVQPADPSDWQTPPFTLTTKGDRYYGRGATDDKGPAVTALLAADYAKRYGIKLNFKFIWELEEEIGSLHFDETLAKHRDLLAAESALVSDSIWIQAGRPTIDYGLRGLVTFTVTLTTGRQDAHSGLTGGVARNPLGEISRLITECYDANTGRVLIPDFYDAVTRATTAELDDFESSGFDPERFRDAHGLKSLRTTNRREILERIMALPAFEVHGISGGYTGPGVKTVVPPSATAKLSIRLVPHQQPKAIFELVKAFILGLYPDAKIELEAAAEPYLSERGGHFANAARSAARFAFGRAPAFVREGGTIGAVTGLHRELKLPVMLMGLSLPEHGYHAPNEYFDWDQAAGGLKYFAKYFAEISYTKG